jgi:hypothetical protein
MTPHELQYNLHSFTGTEGYYKHMGNTLLTDGTKYLAEEAGAWWLMDMIASYVHTIKDRFAIAILTKTENDKALFTLQDDVPANTFYATQAIEYTDFPLDEIKLYVVSDGKSWVVMLPGEY